MCNNIMRQPARRVAVNQVWPASMLPLSIYQRIRLHAAVKFADTHFAPCVCLMQKQGCKKETGGLSGWTGKSDGGVMKNMIEGGSKGRETDGVREGREEEFKHPQQAVIEMD